MLFRSRTEINGAIIIKYEDGSVKIILAVVVHKVGREPHVGQTAFVAGVEVAVAADARKTPEVLVFEDCLLYTSRCV